MNWDDLCGINTVTGEAIDIPTLADPDVDHDRRGRAGMPSGATLTAMMSAADALCLTETPRIRCSGMFDGISFHIAQHMPGGTFLTVTGQFVGQKIGLTVCYENAPFSDTLVDRVDVIVGNIIMRRSITPRTRCRAGYRQLAQSGPHTIAVPGNNGYSGTPDNTILLFASTGLVFYQR